MSRSTARRTARSWAENVLNSVSAARWKAGACRASLSCLAAYEARHGDSLHRSRTALRRRQWRGVGLKAILAGIIFAGAGLVRQQYGDSLDALEALPVAAGGLALVILVLALALRRR